MLDWGAPHLLWILPAVWLAALVLHLYFRRRRMVVCFSDLEFFLRDEHHPAMRRRLRDLLKLLVRFLILTLPVLAVAQPRLRGIAPPGGGGAVRRAIVLDDSFSMERKLPAGETAFQAAQRTALSLLDGFDDGGETALFFTSARPGVLPTADRDKVRQAVREAKTAPRAGTLAETLAEAVRTVRDGEVFLLSDFPKSTLGSWSEAKEARIYALPLRGREDNLSVEIAGFSELPRRAGVRRILRAKVANHSNRPVESRVEFLLHSRPAGERLLSLAPGERTEVAFEFAPPAGECAGSVAVEDENIPGDNRATFSFRVAETLPVALVRGGGRMPDPFYFLRYALDPGGDGRFGVRFEELSPAELGSGDLRRFGLVIVAGTVPEARCDEFVKNGGRLWRLPAPEAKSVPAAGKKAAFAGALAPLNDLLEMDFVEWKQIVPPAVPAGAETWLRLGDGTPLLTARRLGDSIRFDSAFDLRSRASNWPLLRSFPVAMAKLVEAMAPDDGSSVTRSEPAGAESEPAAASAAELRRTLPGVRELRLDGDWRLRLEELRRGTELAGWLLLAALLLFGVDCWMCRKEAA